jgi:hypothetical protein
MACGLWLSGVFSSKARDAGGLLIPSKQSSRSSNVAGENA